MSSLDTNLKIKLIRDENSPYIQQVNQLADANSKTLGFRYDCFYLERAKNPGILVALLDNKMVGYLIWSINKRKRIARLWQLCIKPEYRGRKIAKSLNNEFLKLAYESAREIRFECKDNYGIDRMWCALGYFSIFEKPAKTKGHTLKVWSMQFISNEPSIFSLNTSESTIKCAIDAYTLHKLMKKSQHKESIEWLSSELGICVTEEIFNEIDQFYPNRKKQLWNLVNTQFSKLESEPLIFQNKYEFIKAILKQNKIEIEETDIRHIARCLASDIPYFLTEKINLLSISPLIYKNINVKIISLKEGINLQESDTDITGYQPLHLENKSIQLQTLSQFNLEKIATAVFQLYPNSNQEKLLRKLREFENNDKIESHVLYYQNEPQILFVYDISQQEQLEVPFLRVIKETSLTTTLLNFVVNHLVEIAISDNYSFLKITDPFIREPEKIILERQYFTKNIEGFEWIKPCLRDTLNSQEVINYLFQASKNHPEYKNMSQFLRSWLNSEEVLKDPLYCMDMERLLWPLKIENTNIPNFIIPIKPEYAKELFDKNLAKENLFGNQRTDLFLGLDRVYYKSSKSSLKKAPARIFWYVSKCQDNGYSDLSH
ncbi:GNAT family N-acetyltransferase [Cyanobacterium aponinum FACHB-4101]|uniref:GNAT family N-acetyltransferase n=1 Tax=Cyanobacterium aponinum TaxID=379064 RepID=UPI0016815549|nr:GNAT family N-acetyltransferase [Cyanobacterium aponinum]MBD2395665.1 GNAT family N-acetyltransferase [Cyanobacterium aponinum FACHB-4101]